MDCRSTILIDNNLIWVKIRTKADYNYKSQITWREWLSPSRYEVGLLSNKNGQGYRYWINKSKSIWH